MDINNLHLAKSAMTDKVYVGIPNIKEGYWEEKKDVTADFMKVLVDRYAGYVERFSLNSKIYEAEVREIIRCKNCKYKTTISEGELYGMYQSGGDSVDWCNYYDTPIGYYFRDHPDEIKCKYFEEAENA